MTATSSLFPAADPPTVPPAAGTPEAALDIGAASDPAQVRAAADWLRWGRCRGLASEALLFAALAGTAPRPGDFHGRTLPASRSELYACLRLTHEQPWTLRGLDPLAEAFPAWRALRGHWAELAATLAAEIGASWPEVDRSANGGFWPTCPNTTALLRRVMAQAGVSI